MFQNFISGQAGSCLLSALSSGCEEGSDMGAVRGIPLFMHNREITLSGLKVKVKEPARKLFERHKHGSGRRLGMDLGLA